MSGLDENGHETPAGAGPDRRQIVGGGAAGTLAWLMSLGQARAQVGVDSFIGAIMMVAFNFAPKGWALCNGQLLPINQNQALFSLLGTNFGGNGTSNFALPDLRGRTPVGAVNNGIPGSKYGVENHTLVGSEMPQHNHVVNANSLITATGRGKTIFAAGNLFGGSNNGSATIYGQAGAAAQLANNVGLSGGNQPHSNIQPGLGLNFVIALVGIFPSRN